MPDLFVSEALYRLSSPIQSESEKSLQTFFPGGQCFKIGVSEARL